MMKRLAALVLAALVGGCASLSGDYGLIGQALLKSHAPLALPNFGSGLNAKYRYLAVYPQGGIKAVFIMGFERSTPLGLVEVWYSADGVMLETLNGRLSGTRGYPVQWASVQWAGDASALVRTRDDLTHGIFGVVDLIHPVAVEFSGVPAHVWSPWLSQPAVLANLSWFTDKVHTQPSTGAPAAGWVAQGVHRGQSTWVFSHQCLAVDFCLHLARWPLEIGPAS